MESWNKYHRSNKTKKKKRAKIKKKRILALFVLLIMCFLIGAGIRYMLTGRTLKTEASWPEVLNQAEEGQHNNLLLAVVDTNNILEYMLLLNNQKDGQTTNVLFIPGDTYVDSSGNDVETLMESYTGGQISLINTVRDYIGVDVNDFIIVRQNMFNNLANDLDITHEVDLNAVKQEIRQMRSDGEESEDDLSQVLFTHLNYLSDFYDRVKQETGLFNAPRTRTFISNNIETNLSWEEFSKQVEAISDLESDSEISAYNLPGSVERVNDQAYLVLNVQETELIINNIFSNESNTIEPGNITVEVLNGCGIPGAAEEMADLLEEEGFQIASIGNTDFDHETSQVIALSEPIQAAKEVSPHVNMSDFMVELDRDSETIVKVIVGENYQDK